MDTRFPNLLCAALFAALPAVGCCEQSPKPTATAPAKKNETLAGVVYNPSASLDAAVKPFFDPAKPPREARTFRVTYKGADNGTVPALFTAPGDGRGAVKRLPVVVIIHGLGGRKEDTLLLSVALARRGYASFAIDLAAHGERAGSTNIADMTLVESRQSAAVSITDLRRGLDYLQTRPDVDGGRVGLVGISLGGIYGGVFAGLDKRVGATALWSAGGDWGKLLTESQQRFAVARRERGKVPDAATVESVMRDVDPLTYAARITPRPLLLLAGTQDTIVPNACTDALFDAAKEPKTLERLPGGHVPDPRTLTVRTMDFFDRVLKPKSVNAAVKLRK
ncbi:MAG: alpha/beta hydrolase [Armatimonadetes bacterium]|nr:alpha/beta hydrolase [Armatimonadota bacterium]